MGKRQKAFLLGMPGTHALRIAGKTEPTVFPEIRILQDIERYCMNNEF